MIFNSVFSYIKIMVIRLHTYKFTLRIYTRYAGRTGSHTVIKNGLTLDGISVN